MHSVLTAVQLLWVNLIMDTFAALALATDPPTEKILDRKPQPKSAPLITTNMWKMIIGQAIFQLVATLVLYFAGMQLLGYTEDQRTDLDTMIFNTFVWMQIFNEFNNRRLDNKFNILEGVQRNKFFILINILMVGLQVLIIFVGGIAFEIKEGGISGTQWGICLGIAVICLPWAVLVRLFPDEWFAAIVRVTTAPIVVVYRFLAKYFSKFFRVFKKNKKGSEELPEDEESAPAAAAAASPVTKEKVSDGSEATPAAPIPVITTSPTGVVAPEITVSPEVAPAPPAIQVDNASEQSEKKH